MASVGASDRHNVLVSSVRPESGDSRHQYSTPSPTQRGQRPPKHHTQVCLSPRAPLVLPVTGQIQTEAMSFFELFSVKYLNEYSPSESWRKTLMYFSQTVPAVRHAAMALALNHRRSLEGDTGDQEQPFEGCQPPDKTSLLHYNRAIQLLLNQETRNGTEATAITLLVCYLFMCFDQLSGNCVQAMKHLRGGVELSRNVNVNGTAMNKTNDTIHDDTSKSLGTSDLIRGITAQIRRLDMQAATYLVTWDPSDIPEPLPPSKLPVAPCNYSFHSVDQAAEQLQTLVSQAMKLFHSRLQLISPIEERLPSSTIHKDTIIRQLEAWSNSFEHMLQNSHVSSDQDPAFLCLLRLQYLISWTLVSARGTDRETNYDHLLPQFKQCLALASQVAAAHERYSDSKNMTYTPEIGIIPILYVIGAKCRDPAVRREAVRILQRRPAREAIWDSLATARVLERIIEIEEEGLLEDVVIWQRVEHIFWSVAPHKVDIKYSLWMQREVQSESLDLNRSES